MSCKLFLYLTVLICVFLALEAASLRDIVPQTKAVVPKLDYEGVEANVRSARQSYLENDSGEDSDEDDDEDDAELQHQATINRQQAYEQSVDDSQEGSDEDNEDNFEENDDDNDYFGRRLKRAASETEHGDEIKTETSASHSDVITDNQNKPPVLETSPTSPSTTATTGSANTSVLILIRDAIKKVTELPNTQQVATSAQQYFQMFEHFLQQTIEQVIGDDDEEDDSESTTGVAETVTEISDQQSEKPPLNETNDNKENLNELQPASTAELEQKLQDVDEVPA